MRVSIASTLPPDDATVGVWHPDRAVARPRDAAVVVHGHLRERRDEPAVQLGHGGHDVVAGAREAHVAARTAIRAESGSSTLVWLRN